MTDYVESARVENLEELYVTAAGGTLERQKNPARKIGLGTPCDNGVCEQPCRLWDTCTCDGRSHD